MYSILNTTTFLIISLPFPSLYSFSVGYKKEIRKAKKLKEAITNPNKLASKIYRSVKGEDVIFNEEFELYLKLNDKEDRQLMDGLKAVPLPALKELRIHFLPPKGDSGMSEFLSNSCPPKLKLLALSNPCSELIDTSKYMGDLEKVLPRVTKEVVLSYFKANKSEVEVLFKLSHKLDRLIMRCFKLPSVEEYDFSLPEDQTYSISYINFALSGHSSYSDWSSHPERLESLVAGMSKCSLKQSLKQINVDECGIAKEKVEEMFKKYSMHVDVDDDWVGSL